MGFYSAFKVLNWQNVSAPALGHLQVTKVFIRGNYTICHKIYHSKAERYLVVVQYSNPVQEQQRDLVQFSIDILYDLYCIGSSNKYFCELKMA